MKKKIIWKSITISDTNTYENSSRNVGIFQVEVMWKTAYNLRRTTLLWRNNFDVNFVNGCCVMIL